MIIRTAVIALASASLVFGPTAAAAAPVDVEEARASTPVDEAEAIRGWAWILLLVAGLVALGVTVLDDNPQSP